MFYQRRIKKVESYLSAGNVFRDPVGETRVLVSSARRADDITRERLRESLGQIRRNRTSMIVS